MCIANGNLPLNRVFNQDGLLHSFFPRTEFADTVIGLSLLDSLHSLIGVLNELGQFGQLLLHCHHLHVHGNIVHRVSLNECLRLDWHIACKAVLAVWQDFIQGSPLPSIFTRQNSIFSRFQTSLIFCRNLDNILYTAFNILNNVCSIKAADDVSQCFRKVNTGSIFLQPKCFFSRLIRNNVTRARIHGQFTHDDHLSFCCFAK